MEKEKRCRRRGNVEEGEMWRKGRREEERIAYSIKHAHNECTSRTRVTAWTIGLRSLVQLVAQVRWWLADQASA
jgi:hypothetical protein